MPNFEESSKRTQQTTGANQISIDKIFGIISRPDGGDTTNLSKASRGKVALKDSSSFYDVIKRTKDSDFILAAGTDISSIFYPFSSRIEQSGVPSFHGKIPPKEDFRLNHARFLPFEWASGVQTTIKDRYVAPSGDANITMISSDKFYSDSDRFRDLHDQRGVGIRLPIVGVGWGYTNDGIPWPSGEKPLNQAEGTHYPSGTKFFKGRTREGYNVDPADYVAAPIDLRYDRKNHVWTGPKGFWAKLGNSRLIRQSDDPIVSGYAHDWEEVYDEPSGYMKTNRESRSGTITNNPAFESNGRSVPSGYKVFLEPRDRTDYFLFEYSGLPVGTGRYKVLTIIDDLNPGTPIWDYSRFT